MKYEIWTKWNHSICLLYFACIIQHYEEQTDHSRFEYIQRFVNHTCLIDDHTKRNCSIVEHSSHIVFNPLRGERHWDHIYSGDSLLTKFADQLKLFARSELELELELRQLKNHLEVIVIIIFDMEWQLLELVSVELTSICDSLYVKQIRKGSLALP